MYYKIFADFLQTKIFKQMKKNRKWLFVGIGLILIALIVGAIIKGKSSKKGIKVSIAEVETRTIKEVVAGSGKIYPEIEVKISSDVSGEIVKLMIKEGDSVKANQILAIVNPDTYESIVERAKASLNNSKAQLQTQGRESKQILLNANRFQLS